MKIISWNVAGLRARLKNNQTGKNHLMNALFNQISENSHDYKYYDIVCLQETKCNEEQANLESDIKIRYPYRFWNCTKGTTQRKGFSGVSIWSTKQPKSIIATPEFDEEGRVLSLEFDDFIIVNVYVPNSQDYETERYFFRKKWNDLLIDYIGSLKETYTKEIIICGDFNVAHLDLDINNPIKKKNKVAGFFDNERLDFAYLMEKNELCDIFRHLNPFIQRSTYWSNFLRNPRNKYNGWGLDYYLISVNLISKVQKCNILKDIMGSDHCPLELILN